MDLSTLLGLLGAFAIISVAILVGGSAGTFVNLPGLLIVVGGTLMVTLTKYSFAETLGSFKVAMKAFFHKPEKPIELIKSGVQLANVARKEGMLGLEKQQVSSEFLKKVYNFASTAMSRISYAVC